MPTAHGTVRWKAEIPAWLLSLGDTEGAERALPVGL